MKTNDQADRSSGAVPATNDAGNPKSKIENPKADDAQPVRSPRVFAGECPNNPDHKATRVYKTLGEVRYCVCDDCGRTWKQSGPRATPKAKEKERSAAA